MAKYVKKDLLGDGRGRPKMEQTKREREQARREQIKKEELISKLAPMKEVHSLTMFDESMIKRAYKLCLLGLTNSELAIALNISLVTLNAWANKIPAFKEALMQGREIASANVAQSLFKRAVGFEREVEEARTVDKEVQIVRYKKYFPPSVQAATYWLNNRDKSRWGDVKKHQIEGTVLHAHGTIPVDLSDMSVEELQLAAKLGMKLVDQEKELTTVAGEDNLEVQFLPKNVYDDGDDSYEEDSMPDSDEDMEVEDSGMDYDEDSVMEVEGTE